MNSAKRTNVLVLFLVALALIISPSLRAADSSDWTNLKQLTPGQETKVSLTDGKSYQGDLQSMSDDALVIHSANGDQTFPRQTVQRVSIKRNGIVAATLSSALRSEQVPASVSALLSITVRPP